MVSGVCGAMGCPAQYAGQENGINDRAAPRCITEPISAPHAMGIRQYLQRGYRFVGFFFRSATRPFSEPQVVIASQNRFRR